MWGLRGLTDWGKVKDRQQVSVCIGLHSVSWSELFSGNLLALSD